MPSGHFQADPERLKVWLRRLWAELTRIPGPAEFLNFEGGSVEQIGDLRLRLHHCANYAAVLALLESYQSPGSDQKLSLLELGCGSGTLSFAFARIMPQHWQLVATDYSEQLLANARQHYQQTNLRFEVLDVRSLKSDALREIDALFLLEVIEHLHPDEALTLLGSLHRAMKSGTLLIFTTLDRAPFPRPFSGYPPHKVEFSFTTLHQFLQENSPFVEFDIYRLVSPRIAAEEVRAENRGGYLVNRLQRLVSEVSSRFRTADFVRRQMMRFGFQLYTFLPRKNPFDFDGYLNTITIVKPEPSQAAAYDRDSFGLVAVLKR